MVRDHPDPPFLTTPYANDWEIDFLRTALLSQEGTAVSSLTIWKETKRSIRRTLLDEMATGTN